MILEGRSAVNGDGRPRFKFTGKERDTESKYDYFGARYYDARVGRLLAVDRFADKCIDVSPYAYAGNSPVLFVDANGDSVDVSGLSKEQLQQYNDAIAEAGRSENFAKMYNTLASSKAWYKIEFGNLMDKRASAQFVANSKKVGSGGTLTISNTEGINAATGAHELFHAYQSDQGPYFPGTTGNETEAFLFERIVQMDLSQPFRSEKGPFGDAFESLLFHGFNGRDWRTAIREFKDSKVFNSSGLYDKFRSVYYPNPLIRRFSSN
jgi:RHS repeat-associated protein